MKGIKKQEYIRSVVWKDGEVLVYVNGLDENTRYMVDLHVESMNGTETQTVLAVPTNEAAKTELVAIFKLEDEDARFEANLVPMKVRS